MIIYNLAIKEIIGCLSAQTCEYFMKIVTVYILNSHVFTLKAHILKSRMVLALLKYLKAFSINSEDRDKTAPVEAV